MKENMNLSAVSDEQEIMTIVHRLPPERKSQILAFARFLAFETFQTTDLAALEEIDFEDTYTEADARWDQLLASDEGQFTLDRLADAALASIRAGEASAIGFTEDGEIAPR
ncbi:MAG: hypothetical protein R2873_25480 [Caldilineaceae bacterium]|nr:hypothetical protein [Caldilineaceae bacterium]